MGLQQKRIKGREGHGISVHSWRSVDTFGQHGCIALDWDLDICEKKQDGILIHRLISKTVEGSGDLSVIDE